ncbi:MAG: hypothetical protein AUK48_11065 [Oscillatoriales cyanobacterium CG2_30_44_21]|nr:MAG: hypothetical protein AUK48_11065 [Oscillatoriales cyanobacterium CG2_30_44_21]
MKLIAAIVVSIFSANLISLTAEALEEGTYWGGGSRYITIAKKTDTAQKEGDERFCYQGFSNNGSLIASLKLTIPRYQTGIDYEVYTLQDPENNLAIQQYAFKRSEIIFGSLVGRFVKGTVYKREENLIAGRSPDLAECLNSNKPYFKIKS